MIQVAFDVVERQEFKEDFLAGAPAFEREPHGQKGMRPEYVREPVRGNDQNPDVFHPLAQVSQQVAGRRIGPVQIVQE